MWEIRKMDINKLYLYQACSANDDKNQHLWVDGAALFIPQTNSLLKCMGYKQTIINIDEFLLPPLQTGEVKTLGDILSTYGSDKSNTVSPKLNDYHIFYSYVFNKLGKHSELTVLEVGLGTNNPDLVSTMGVNGKPGASIKAFRDYLPNSRIYGSDIDKDILFKEDRIDTCYVDQMDIESFKHLHNSFGNIEYDVIIDDGLHSIAANFNTLLFAIDNIAKNGWIIIEDIHLFENYKCIDFILSTDDRFETMMIKAKGAYMYAVHRC
jgi:hypothetical protein